MTAEIENADISKNKDLKEKIIELEDDLDLICRLIEKRLAKLESFYYRKNNPKTI
ncbi:MAG: hypothetical protein AAB772_03270 [Patescibacteria group bacterium]